MGMHRFSGSQLSIPTNLMLATVWALSSVMFPLSRQPKTSRRQRCTLCRSWTQDPARIHYGSIRSGLLQSYEWPPDSTSYCRWHPHRCRSRDPHSVYIQFWNCETTRREEREGKWSVNVLRFTQLGITSTKLVCLASRTVTTACTSSISFCFSSSSKFMYHLARRVLPARFCMSINRIWKAQELWIVYSKT